ncbi:MAG: NusG domain II-containing protein [Bacilli bacterium]|nr:NusG domain II-containing protein [Bacilli bacterium]
MMDKKKLRNDLILVGSLLLVAISALITINVISKNKNTSNLIATVSVQNTVVEVIDLSKREDKHYYVEGLHGQVHIHTKDGAIAILESNCPHQDCVHMGYVSDTSHPIICAYNAVYITIGVSPNDVDA